MMPTTRYGRYKLYRQRTRIRLRRVEGRRVKHDGIRTTVTTAVDTTGATKQMPRRADGPRHVGNDPATFASVTVTVVPAEYRQPAVCKFTAGAANPVHPNWHARSGIIGYQNRRLTWIPRLRQLPRLYPLPLPATAERSGYPFMPYPSGQRNPRGYILGDGVGPCPPGWEGWHGESFLPWYLYGYDYFTPYMVTQDVRDFYPGSAAEWPFWLPIIG